MLDVLFEGTRAVGVRIQDEQGNQREVRASVVVDAPDKAIVDGSAWTAAVGSRAEEGSDLGLLERGSARHRTDEGATLVIQTHEKKGWFWYIPLQNDIISVGVVADFEYLFNNRTSREIEKIYAEEIGSLPWSASQTGWCDVGRICACRQRILLPIQSSCG